MFNLGYHNDGIYSQLDVYDTNLVKSSISLSSSKCMLGGTNIYIYGIFADGYNGNSSISEVEALYET